MNKVKTLDDLRKMRETLRSTLDIREKSNHPEQMVQIRISMATCGIAAGAKEIMNYFIEALDREKVDALVTQTGCMGYCYAEPTVEVTLPGKEPLVFGHVKKAKVDEIIDLTRPHRIGKLGLEFVHRHIKYLHRRTALFSFQADRLRDMRLAKPRIPIYI